MEMLNKGLGTWVQGEPGLMLKPLAVGITIPI